jgi:hypothetical protein
MLKDLDLNGFADLAVCLSVSDSVAVLLNVNGAVVPTLVSAIGYVFLDGRLTITWESSALRSVTASVYRQEESVWHRKGIASRDGVDGFRWFDHDVVPGQSYRYRLGIVEGAGEIPAGEVTIEIPSVVHFGVTMIGANPSSGVIRCAVDLETDELTTLSLWDISGRRIASRNVGTYGLGHHVVDLTDGVTLAPGVYVVSLEDGRQAKSLRVSVVR